MIKACREVFKTRLLPIDHHIFSQYNKFLSKPIANFSDLAPEKPKKTKKEKTPKTETTPEKKPRTKKSTEKSEAAAKKVETKAIKAESQETENKIKVKEGKGVDVCILLDTSGSMYHHFDIVKSSINNILDNHKESKNSKGPIRFGVIGYRDIYDRKRFEIMNFKNSINDVWTFINDLSLIGGNDNPEDVNGALQQALYGMKWENATKILYHWADGACHGKEFHREKDDFPDGYREDMKWEALFKEMKKINMNYTFFDVETQNRLMFEKLKSIYDESGRKKSKLSFDYMAVSRPKPVEWAKKNEINKFTGIMPLNNEKGYMSACK